MSKQLRRIRVIVWLPVILFLVVILGGVESGQAGLTGKVIDNTNYQEYKDLLIPMQIEAIKRDGGWRLQLATLDYTFKHDDKFIAGTEKNAGKFDIAKGWIVDKNTRKQVPYIFGLPFPKIDTKNPQVAEMIMWNFKYQYYRRGTSKTYGGTYNMNESGLEMTNGGKFLQFLTQSRYDGPVANNPDNILSADHGWLEFPMSQRGGGSVTFEYNDDRLNTTWAYSPLVRRVLRMGGGNRSQPTMGGDYWLDSLDMWKGKNSTFNWKLVGERTVLAAFFGTAKGVAKVNSDGSITFLSHPSKFGFMVSGWKGAAWVPVDLAYVPRKVWVVEGMPKDPYYNFGRHVFYVDKETYIIWLSEVFDKAGNPWLWQYRREDYFEAPNGMNSIGISQSGAIFDVKVRHASGSYPVEEGTFFLPASAYGLDRFNTTELLKTSVK